MFIKMHKNDNVIIAVESIPKGTEVVEGIVVNEDIPQGHKIAIKDLDQGERIIHYGVTLGYALKPIKRGDWVN
ncbi:UxaA family hydrolase, partial [Pseudomonas oryzihabitans]|uniref:UxaA family hydrolase n=1 Tax=Pseudomonas oryzihabitans TaxID=47885 RepID=UPI002B1E6543